MRNLTSTEAERMGGNVTLQRYLRPGYTINREEILAARQILKAIPRRRQKLWRV